MSKEIKDMQKNLAVIQRDIKEKGIPVLILFEGWENSGKGSMINTVIKEMDPRSFAVKVFERETEEEQRRPFLWRFWRDIPPKGHFRIFDRSHYLRLMRPESKKQDLSQKDINDIWAFEKQLSEDGTILIKFFLNVSKKEQERRIRKLEKSKYSSFRVSEEDKEQQKQYEFFAKRFEKMLEITDFNFAPWQIIDSEDKEESAGLVLDHIIKRLTNALEQKKSDTLKNEGAYLGADEQQSKLVDGEEELHHLQSDDATEEEQRTSDKIENKDEFFQLLDQIDLSKKLDKDEYKQELKRLQKEAKKLAYKLYVQKIPTIIAFEGWDAAGKGGAIKRLTEKIDPRGYEVIPIAAPDQTEKQYHYMWRFYKHLPKTGHMKIFDRSWYGRVMVERIEGFATPQEWMRAFDEINQNEEHIAKYGTLILKFFLHIDKQQQLDRFNDRQKDPDKSYKLTDEDWRNREKWDAYQNAIGEMITKTDTDFAPWVIVEGNDKYYARIKVLSAFVDAAKKALK